jgi:hypothetical protein
MTSPAITVTPETHCKAGSMPGVLDVRTVAGGG